LTNIANIDGSDRPAPIKMYTQNTF